MAKKEVVQDIFNDIAPKYDLLNHLLSMNIDKGWRRKAMSCIGEQEKGCLLDVACGTGDFSIAAHRAGVKQVTGIDISENMVGIGKKKVGDLHLADAIELKTGDCEHMEFATGMFDVVTVAFGVRNFEDIPGGLTGLFSALRPGGKLFVLEFGMPRGRIFGTVYRFYFHRVLPRLGGWVSRDGKAYSYLPRSVDEFPYGEAFVRLLAEAGFEDCDCRNLFGGVAQIYTARRPDACEKTEKRR